MQTINKIGDKYNRNVCEFVGLSTDTKPTGRFTGDGDIVFIGNGSTFYEIDTQKTHKYNAENKSWTEVSA